MSPACATKEGGVAPGLFFSVVWRSQSLGSVSHSQHQTHPCHFSSSSLGVCSAARLPAPDPPLPGVCSAICGRRYFLRSSWVCPETPQETGKGMKQSLSCQLRGFDLALNPLPAEQSLERKERMERKRTSPFAFLVCPGSQ